MRIFNYFKLFVALAVVAMAFVACEPDKPTNDTPKEYALEITSEATMEFPAEGGEGVIEWALNEVTRTSPVPEALPTFSTEAAWITLDADNLGAFAVAVNEGEAREAVINIEYKEQKFAVTVKQAAATPAPVEAVELAFAMRFSNVDIDVPANSFVLYFADEEETLELGILLIGAEGDEVLQAGTYSVANGGFDAEISELSTATDDYCFTDGVVEVAVEGEVYSFDMTFTAESGEEFYFVYEGEVDGMVQEPVIDEPVAFTPAAVKAELYESGNFFLQLYIDGANYHELDMYDVVAPNVDYLSAGLYSFADETISSWSTFYRGNDQTCGLADAEITLTHNADSTTTITGYIKSEEGDHITIDWTGVIEGMNLAGGDEPENPVDGDYYTFVSADICFESGWDDFQIEFIDANGVILTCDFYECTDVNFLPEDEYLVGEDSGCVYADSYSFIDLNDGGSLQDLYSGKVVVAEVDGQYSFTFENITYGDDLKSFSGVYVGQVGSTVEGWEGLVVPSEYKEPEISDEVTELTIYSWFESYDIPGQEHELNFVYDTAAMRVVTIDFLVNPITAGTYELGVNLSKTYCKFQSKTMQECTVVVTENTDGNLTFDANFVVDYSRYHFTWTGNPATLAD